jgi:hypothetical protein
MATDQVPSKVVAFCATNVIVKIANTLVTRDAYFTSSAAQLAEPGRYSDHFLLSVEHAISKISQNMPRRRSRFCLITRNKRGTIAAAGP